MQSLGIYWHTVDIYRRSLIVQVVLSIILRPLTIIMILFFKEEWGALESFKALEINQWRRVRYMWFFNYIIIVNPFVLVKMIHGNYSLYWWSIESLGESIMDSIVEIADKVMVPNPQPVASIVSEKRFGDYKPVQVPDLPELEPPPPHNTMAQSLNPMSMSASNWLSQSHSEVQPRHKVKGSVHYII